MDVQSLKKEMSYKMHLHSTNTSLYRKTYNKFNETIGSHTIRDKHFFLSKPHFAIVAKSWNIETNNNTIDKLYNTIQPSASRVNYNELVKKLVD